MSRRKRVALLIESSRAYGRACLLGVARYIRSHGPWEVIHYERGLMENVPSAMQDWQGDGLITRIENQEVADIVARLNAPAVDLRGAIRPVGGAMLDTDHVATARMAADHFFEIGLRQFAFCGYPGIEFSDAREQAFVDYLRGRGVAVACYRPESSSAVLDSATIDSADREALGEQEHKRLAVWLRSLPGPVAVMACNDVRGRQVVDACADAELSVPEQVAILGVDNDEVLCELSNPPLSSIEPNAHEIGYLGARLLDRMMDGDEPPEQTLLVPPVRVHRRISSEATAVDDPSVSLAMQIIRDRATLGLSVEEVAAEVGASRSTLERRFRNIFGRSPAAEIERLRMAKAKLLLSETDYRMAKIADIVGYRSAAQFVTTFKRHANSTPGQYRARKQSQEA